MAFTKHANISRYCLSLDAGSVPVVAVATKVYGEFVWALSKSMQDTLAASMKVAEEAFSSMLTVRSMAAEKSVARDVPTTGRDSEFRWRLRMVETGVEAL